MIYKHLILLLSSGVLLAPADTASETPNYRLPKTHLPNEYNLTLKLNSGTFKGKSKTFTGTVIINITVLDKSSKEIKLHADSTYITVNSVKLNGVTELSHTIDVTSILTIDLGTETTKDSLSLTIKFKGIHREDMNGFYLSNYQEKNTAKYLVTTQFQPTHARSAFPCFDEPEFKATFQVKIEHPKSVTALSNTKGTTTNEWFSSTTTFEKTPIMSTYLLAFIVSEFTCTESKTDAISFPHSVCSRNETIEMRQLALMDGPLILAELNNYTGILYETHMHKMHQLAIPDFSAGAMENWGLVTYREIYLLWSEKESTNINKQQISTVIAHELAHQWFGNLVTTRWWDTTFLNEGFATYFEYFITHKIHPDWELDKQFIIDEYHSAFEADCVISAGALKSNVSSPSEVSAIFNTISYSKGGSILRMVEHILGSSVFQSGLQAYLKERSLNYTEPKFLWESLNAVSQSLLNDLDLNTVMKNWVENPGYPLVTVNVTGNKVELTQKRFLIGNDPNKTNWHIPISYTQSTDKNKFANTFPQTWLKPNESLKFAVNESSEWIILNNQHAGYFRVNYDDVSWEKIRLALKKDDFDGIHELNRAQIANDVFGLAKTGYISYGKAFAILEFLETDVSYYSWSSAVSGFNYLLKRLGTGSTLGQSIQAHSRKLITKLYESVPFSKLNNTDHIYTAKQVMALSYACQIGIESCKTAALGEFDKYKTTKIRPDPNLRKIAYCNGLRYSKDKSNWEYLWDSYKSTDDASEKMTILSALSCTTDKELLNKYLEFSIDSSSGIRSQDSLSVFSAVYSNFDGVEVAFNFLKNNYVQIKTSYKSLNALVAGLADTFTTNGQINELKEFIKSLDTQEYSGFITAAKGALKSAESNVEWVEKYKKELNEYYGIPQPGSSCILMISVNVFVISLIGLLFLI
ncbi:unnamed protein product [Brassicogethes aeneus]|uniref:Aminopeptidase n=1 Tax=Brassicogethes aeneus TaxID=1431903 RepID=A0A9P0B1W2_BRAAE|nr:unnamed protein product [Brassicogethes aeneus]